MSNKDNPKHPAFPVNDNVYGPESIGLNKREYFAGLAMQGLLASCNGWCSPMDAPEISKRAIAFAQTLLIELDK